MTTPDRRSSADVEAWFISHADHANLPTLTALCDVVDGISDRVRCEIKWNAPSYALTDHFATTGLAPSGGVRLVLHTGAAKRETPLGLRNEVADPTGLLRWNDQDRATVMFLSVTEVAVAREPLSRIITRWIELTQSGEPGSDAQR